MNSKRQNQGFTLLEVIIVIIIVGVLSSLALPRFFSTVEYSRSTEALNAFSALRESLERCYGFAKDYTNCGFGNLDIANPGTSPNAHFSYATTSLTSTGYVVTATRNTHDGGSTNDTIVLTYTETAGTTRGGTTKFGAVK